MNQIADLLPPANIALDLDVPSKSRLFEAVGALFAASGGLDAGAVAGSLAAREKLGSTGLGQGIAIPHGRIKGLQGGPRRIRPPAPPVAFDAPDGKPVSQVFVLLVPEQATDLHLQLLSELAQMFSERDVPRRAGGRSHRRRPLELFRAWQPRCDAPMANARPRRSPSAMSSRDAASERPAACSTTTATASACTGWAGARAATA